MTTLKFPDNAIIVSEDGIVFRVLETHNDCILLINCIKKTMPEWIGRDHISALSLSEIQDIRALLNENADTPPTPEQSAIAHKRYNLIVGILPFIGDLKTRNMLISKLSAHYNISKQTIRHYLCSYLIYEDILSLVPKPKSNDKELTDTQKIMRWALNKFYYTRHKNSLTTAYTMMLEEKYTDSDGKLLSDYPSFAQFRYFYRKSKDMRKYHISRDGIKAYERDSRPLLGDGVQSFAPVCGYGLMDSTTCDIYLVDDSGNVIGRPILTTCLDGYSGLCMGYSLSWQGGTYSLRDLLMNIISDKREICDRFGINLEKGAWDCAELPGIIVTDMGAEYLGETFTQITELGISIEDENSLEIVSVGSFRPDLKGTVESFFNAVQNLFKPYLKDKGVIQPDFGERGAIDYRKQACLTMRQFEAILIHCILYYNSRRIVEGFPFTSEMLSKRVKPYSCEIWSWGKNIPGSNLIPVSKEQLALTLLPRTTGRFTRQGLKVNGLRYKCSGYDGRFLTGGEVTVAFNSDNVNRVWLIEKGEYSPFSLIESRFNEMTLDDTENMKSIQKSIISAEKERKLQAGIDLARHIKVIADQSRTGETANIKNISNIRKTETQRTHKDFVKEAGIDE